MLQHAKATPRSQVPCAVASAFFCSLWSTTREHSFMHLKRADRNAQRQARRRRRGMGVLPGALYVPTSYFHCRHPQAPPPMMRVVVGVELRALLRTITLLLFANHEKTVRCVSRVLNRLSVCLNIEAMCVLSENSHVHRNKPKPCMSVYQHPELNTY